MKSIVVVGTGAGCGLALVKELLNLGKYRVLSVSRSSMTTKIPNHKINDSSFWEHIEGDAAEPETHQKINKALLGHQLEGLICSVWGADDMIEWDKSFTSFSTTSIHEKLTILNNKHMAHALSAHTALSRPSTTETPFFISITDGETWHYRGNYFYDQAKTSLMRLIFSLSREFPVASFNMPCLNVTPGFLRSENMLSKFGLTEANYKQQSTEKDFAEASETPHFLARGLLQLIQDDDRAILASLHGKCISSWRLSELYQNVTDLDGTRPHWGKYFEKTYGKVILPDDNLYNDHFINGPFQLAFPNVN